MWRLHHVIRVLWLSLLCLSLSSAFQTPQAGRMRSKLQESTRATTRTPYRSVPLMTRRATTDEQQQQQDILLEDPFATARQKEQSRLARRSVLATIRRAVTEEEDEARDKQDQFFLMLAFIPSLVAFLLWEDISHSLAVFLDMYGAIGKAVDGGMFAANLLRPTITGVVVPVISIALATLVSTTVNVLRARQVELRALVNKESCELRLIRRAVFGMFGTRQHAIRRAKALALLYGYVEQLERESSVGAVEALEELQLSGGIAVNELDKLAEMLHGVDGAAASRQGSVGVADSLILSLSLHRSERVALLLSVFPVIHWGILIALSLSICVTFLLVSNQEVLQYLNSVQLRALFAILVGVFSGTATLCLDLADPFRGSFSIAEASTQLEDLRLCLKEDVTEACAEAGEISSKFVNALLLGGSRDSSIDSSAMISRRHTTSIEPSRQLSNKIHAKNGDWDNDSKDVSVANFQSNSDSGRDDLQDWDIPQRRYGLVSTLYFHLLTGPLGSNVRVLGDVIAWMATFVANRTRSLSQRVMAVSASMSKKSWRRHSRRNTLSTEK